MAYVKLLPPDTGALPVAEVVRRLRAEFAVLDSDPDEGQGHVAGMIAATLRFRDDLPGKQERLAWLQSVQHEAVYVTFGDDPAGPCAWCCVMPDSELFFDDRDAIDGPARPPIERAGRALGYTVSDW